MNWSLLLRDAQMAIDGIPVLIVGSFFPCVYYAFFCDPLLQILYLTAISIAGLGRLVSATSDLKVVP